MRVAVRDVGPGDVVHTQMVMMNNRPVSVFTVRTDEGTFVTAYASHCTELGRCTYSVLLEVTAPDGMTGMTRRLVKATCRGEAGRMAVQEGERVLFVEPGSYTLQATEKMWNEECTYHETLNGMQS